MEKNTVYMLSIVAMVAVVAVVVLTMGNGVVINDGAAGDLSGQAVIKTKAAMQKKLDASPQMKVKAAGNSVPSGMKTTLKNSNNMDEYEYYDEEEGTDANEARTRTSRGMYDCPEYGAGCKCVDFYNTADTEEGITTEVYC